MDKAQRETVQRLFVKALARDPLDRPAFLKGVCGTDSELRAEIESLLAHQSRAEQTRFLWSPPEST